MKPTSITHWPKDDRPREKLLQKGEKHLSNSELLAILLRTGTKGHSAVDLSRQILEHFGTFRAMAHTDISQWSHFKGLGAAKLAQIKAAIEIGRRFREEEIKEDRPQIKNAKDVADLLMPRIRDLKVEVFKVVLLNSQNRVITILDITEGTVNQANPIIREIFQKALQHFAVSIVCVHNHPSGAVMPSNQDKLFAAQLTEAGKMIQIKVLDSIIIGNDEFYSFDEKTYK